MSKFYLNWLNLAMRNCYLVSFPAKPSVKGENESAF